MIVSDDEPPDRETREKTSKLITMVQDKRWPSLLPDKSKGEIATCNPAYCDGHTIHRVREDYKNIYGERSVLKKDGETILTPEYKYEKDGIEDARLSKKGDTYLITYVAFNEDIENGGAKIALATTKNFKKIKRHGIIGPQMRYEEAIDLVGPNSYYGKHWIRELEGIQKIHPGIDPFIPDKDAGLEYVPERKQWALLHRLEPAIQIAYADKISDFRKKKFWVEHIRNLEKYTILKPGIWWAKEKIGIGGLPIDIDGRKIGHIHGVEKRESEGLTQYFYRGTFAEFNPQIDKIIAILRDPMLLPTDKDKLIETSPNGHITEKYVNFPTILKVSPNDISALLTISGWGDEKEGSRTHNKEHILKELSDPHNSIENWNKEVQLAQPPRNILPTTTVFKNKNAPLLLSNFNT
jgi:predicted GH43/DUF377 family glycosyl hydrolase|tara:strand:- start:383 stop:1609 length:1227 start_codon:yes stop_codon:yes gene_type:complete